jgi:hypothetical protein
LDLIAPIESIQKNADTESARCFYQVALPDILLCSGALVFVAGEKQKIKTSLS